MQKKILKRDGNEQLFESFKIEDAIKKQQFDKIENLLKSSHVISLAAEEILKETLNQYPQ